MRDRLIVIDPFILQTGAPARYVQRLNWLPQRSELLGISIELRGCADQERLYASRAHGNERCWIIGLISDGIGNQLETETGRCLPQHIFVNRRVWR